MSAFRAFLAVAWMTAAILFAGAAWAMEIQKFDRQVRINLTTSVL
jgi:hypothetical protein